jgi:WD40 repeat protein
MDFEYKIGGTIGSESPTYIKRVADENLYTSLLQGNLCYVLTSRQMGKSSLKVRVMEKLREDGVKCSSIDASFAGDNENVTANQWYRGLINRWVNDLGLKKFVNINEFWEQHEEFAFSERLDEFVNTILFTHISAPVVIFIDEIDSTIDLDFTDDFFTWIRYCFNVREENSNYKRLTFCFVGVATPTDLIKNQTRTPFNIGKSIEPLRFQESQLNPLMEGLRGKVADLERVQHEIHKWTGGQPFLTQRLCYLIQSELEQIEFGQEEESITQLVESKIIENWEYNDEPVHLKTIRDRLLKDEDKAVSLLGLYQQILEGMESKESIEVSDNLSDVMALRLTGLVVSEEGRLFVYNQIYQRVFSAAWVAQELAKLRPYAVSLVQWLGNDRDDKYLLTGQGFLDSQKWSLTRRLTQEDSQYLAASQKLHTENFQAQAEEIINKAKKRATLFTVIGLSGLIGSVITSGIAWFNFNEVSFLNSLDRASTEVRENYPVYSLYRIITTIKTGRELQKKVKNISVDNYPLYSPLLNLQQVVATEWQEINRFEFDENNANKLRISADGQTILTVDEQGIVKLLRQNGTLISTFKNHQLSTFQNQKFSACIKRREGGPFRKSRACRKLLQANSDVRLSADGKTIITVDEQGIVRLLRQNGTLISTFKNYQSKFDDIVLSADGKTIVTVDKQRIIRLLRRDGTLIFTFENYQAGSFFSAFRDFQKENTVVGISADSKTIVIVDKPGAVKLLNRDGSPISTFKNHQLSTTAVGISADGKTIVSGDYNGNMTIFRRDGSLIYTLKSTKDPIAQIGVSDDGQTIVSINIYGAMKIWRKNTSLMANLTGHQDFVWDVGISADGQTIVSGSDDKTGKIWQRDGTLISTFKNHPYNVNNVAVSADGQTIVSGSSNNRVKIWRRDGSLISTIDSHKDFTSEVGVSADGQIIISESGTQGDISSAVEEVNLWRRDGHLISTLKSDQYSARHVKMSADRQIIVTGNDKTVNLWRQDGSLISVFTDRQNKVTSVGMSADGQTIVSGSNDNTVKLWRRDGSIITTLSGHPNKISSIDVSGDGKIIVSGDDDTVKVWRRDGVLIATLLAGGSPLGHRVGISADGKTIASTGEKTVRMWHFDLDYLLAKGCEQIDDYLNSHPKVNREELCPVPLKGEIAR